MKPTVWRLIMGLFCIPMGIFGLRTGYDFLGGSILWLSGANLAHWNRDVFGDKCSAKEEDASAK